MNYDPGDCLEARIFFLHEFKTYQLIFIILLFHLALDKFWMSTYLSKKNCQDGSCVNPLIPLRLWLDCSYGSVLSLTSSIPSYQGSVNNKHHQSKLILRISHNFQLLLKFTFFNVKLNQHFHIFDSFSSRTSEAKHFPEIVCQHCCRSSHKYVGLVGCFTYMFNSDTQRAHTSAKTQQSL